MIEHVAQRFNSMPSIKVAKAWDSAGLSESHKGPRNAGSELNGSRAPA